MGVRIEEEDVVLEEEPILEKEEEEQEIDETTVDEPEDPENDQDDSDDEEEDRVVTFGDEPLQQEGEKEGPEADAKAPGWVKKVRKVNRKLESENRRLKRELEARSTAAAPKPQPIELGEKPTLKSVGYDDKKYEAELAAYYERKRQIDEQQEEAKKAEAAQAQKWQERQTKYLTQKDAHGFKDFSEAEDMVKGTLNTIQQSVIIHGAEDSALVVYALGKNPKKLEELAKIDDPVEFAVQVGKLESSLKVKNRKAPDPEKRVTGAKSGGLSGSSDHVLEKLREEAARTNDYTKLNAYKHKMRQQRSK